MSQERPTTEIKTPSGFAVVLKTYATGRESNLIQNVYLASAKVSVVGNVPKIDGFDPTAEEKAIAKMIELLVVSVNGSNDGVVDQVLDMPMQDYDVVVAKLNELTGKKKPENTNKA